MSIKTPVHFSTFVSEITAISFVLITIMNGRIHLFQSVQKYQRWMGVYSTQWNTPAPFNYRTLLFLGSYVHFFIPSFSYFVFKATTFREYADCFYAFITSVSNCSFYVAQMVQVTNFDALIRNYEQFIEQSK